MIPKFTMKQNKTPENPPADTLSQPETQTWSLVSAKKKKCCLIFLNELESLHCMKGLTQSKRNQFSSLSTLSVFIKRFPQTSPEHEAQTLKQATDLETTDLFAKNC